MKPETTQPHYLEGGEPHRRTFVFDTSTATDDDPDTDDDDDPDLQTRAAGVDRADRRIPGTAVRYGDVAALPWGDYETFEAGAFGDVGDVILNFQHDRTKPLARTGGCGLDLHDTPTEMRIDAVMPHTTAGNDALELHRAKVMRGYSVEFIPEAWCDEPYKNRIKTVIKSATLHGIGLVDKPAYTGSTTRADRSAIVTPVPTKGVLVDEDQIEKLIDKALEKREDKGADVASLKSDLLAAVQTAIAGQVREQVEAAVEKAHSEVRAAQDEAATAAAKATEERAKIDEQVEERAELITMLKPLLDDGYETRGQTNHQIMIAAAGDEIDDAKNRSEDYLVAKLEGIVERRAAAATDTDGAPRPVAGSGALAHGAVNVMELQRPPKPEGV